MNQPWSVFALEGGGFYAQGKHEFDTEDEADIWATRESMYNDMALGVWELEGGDWECRAIAFGGRLYTP